MAPALPPVAVCIASPSLAITKYWGKEPGGANLPSTGSVAMTLGGLDTVTEVRIEPGAQDEVLIDGQGQPAARFAQFFEALRARTRAAVPVVERCGFRVQSRNSFPTAAGIASSSSGFAALAGACYRAVGLVDPSDPAGKSHELSELARVGSGSACRSVFGGFTCWPAGAHAAHELFPPGHWPDLRVIVAVVHDGPKPATSRDAMNSARDTSPYFAAWRSAAAVDVEEAIAALAARDLTALGRVTRRSYLRMFATMFASDPPVIYWQPASLALIHLCEELRSTGVPAWETMDAGPQVKILTTADRADDVRAAISNAAPQVRMYTAAAGEGLRFPPPAAIGPER